MHCISRNIPQAPAVVMKFAKSPRQGAETSVQLALGDDSNGGYWVDGKSLGWRAKGGMGGVVGLNHCKECCEEGIVAWRVGSKSWPKCDFAKPRAVKAKESWESGPWCIASALQQGVGRGRATQLAASQLAPSRFPVGLGGGLREELCRNIGMTAWWHIWENDQWTIARSLLMVYIYG